ncbi:MAG TPA: PSD1 and planctomycete cytochrome C domain-containing protein [Vicinamibacterales bacterium]|nr:PSD1 and planctomycete cytochrome C domain-containing protein [Vicinamibacterales bacterium]
MLSAAAVVVWTMAVSLQVGASGPSAITPAAATPVRQEGADELARRVYAVFKEHCIKCHGVARESGLDLRTEEGLRTGGVGGPVVVAHKPDESYLYLHVSHAEAPFMPAGAPRLPDESIALIRRWIDAGGTLAGVPEAAPGATEAAAADLAALEERPITDEERAYWAFVKPVRAVVPSVTMAAWQANPIDAFVLDAMTRRGLRPAPRADRRTLIRRAYLDVLGLPPTPDEVEAFVHDPAPDAWPRLVDRLLASGHYGERWARHWMDLVRYADSGGFEFDVDRLEMYRYRDYLIDSFNADKPYDQFLREQLAGDEFDPENDEAMIATGFLRLGPEGGGTRQDALDDLIATTSQAFLGLTINCARCHNHKFDPIPQKDYYRIQAIFYPTRDAEHVLAPEAEAARNRAERQRIDGRLEPVRERKVAIEKPYHDQIVAREVARLPDYMQVAWRTPPDERTDGQKLTVIQIADTLKVGSLRNLVREADVAALMPADVQAEHAAVKAEIRDLEAQRPPRLPAARVIAERGRTPQPSYFLHRGSPDARGSVMTPGVLSVATPGEWTFPEPPPEAPSSWRRRGFAEWLTHRDNPLTARVMVNRLWQHHFGEGIVRTPSNFGTMGEPPSHPALLDWLAVELVDQDWRLKPLHRLMLTSEAYQMASLDIPENVRRDPENRLFWRMPRVRLEAEILRDATLAAAGTLDRTIGGESIFPWIDPDLFERSSRRDWKGLPDDDPSTWRRSLYVFSKRSIRYPMFETFDQPNLVNSTDRRNRTTIAQQALILMNNPTVLFQAGKFAERVRAEAGDDPARQVDRAFRIALGRPPDAAEASRAVAFVQSGDEGLARFCHLLFNLNEFVYRP